MFSIPPLEVITRADGLWLTGEPVLRVALGRPQRDGKRLFMADTKAVLAGLERDGWQRCDDETVALGMDRCRLANDAWGRVEILAMAGASAGAVAQNLSSGEILDPFHGLDDARDGRLRLLPGVRQQATQAGHAMALGASIGLGLGEIDIMQLRDARTTTTTDEPASIWEALEDGLTGPNPGVFLRLLRESGLLARWLPEVDALYGVPQKAQWHPEIDTGVHIEMVVKQAGILAPGDINVAWAALVHDLGKALTPREEWPAHINHEHAGLMPLAEVHARLPVPDWTRELAIMVTREHLTCHQVMGIRPGKLLGLLERDGGRLLKDPVFMEAFLSACCADARGRGGFEASPYPQAQYLRDAALAVNGAISQMGASWIDDGTKESAKAKQVIISSLAELTAGRRDKAEALNAVREKIGGEALRRGRAP